MKNHVIIALMTIVCVTDVMLAAPLATWDSQTLVDADCGCGKPKKPKPKRLLHNCLLWEKR
jgi:hypothetical protein